MRWNVMEPFYTWHSSLCSVSQKSKIKPFLETEYSDQIRNRVVPPNWWNVLLPPTLIAVWLKTRKRPTPNLFPCPTSHSLIPSSIHPSPVAHGRIRRRRSAGGRATVSVELCDQMVLLLAGIPQDGVMGDGNEVGSPSLCIGARCWPGRWERGRRHGDAGRGC
jgi:hypothetical protein